MGWREYAETVKGTRHVRHVRHDRHESPPNVPIVPIVPASPPLDPRTALRIWREGVRSVDFMAPLPGWDLARWQTFYDSALWWLDSFGEQAARHGWGTGDVFGVHPDRVGGLLDRLGDNRSLMMTADRACWRCFGVARSFNRTGGLGLRPFWEAKR